MNTILKGRLQSLFLDNGPRIRNGQKGSKELGLVDWRPKGSSDNACLNILRAEDINRVGAGPRTKQDTNTSTRRDDKSGTEEDDKAGIRRQNNKTSTRKRDNIGVGNRGQDNKADIGKQNKEVRPDNEGAIELVARGCYTGV